jgi:hypothetical protein
MAGPPGTPVQTAVTIGDVVRGSPYVDSNAKDAGLPFSLPPGHHYDVPITIVPPLTGSEFVEIRIVDGEGANGVAVLRSPNQMQRSGIIRILAGSQTEVGHGGKIKIQGVRNGVVVATSNGFGVCAHASAMRRTLKSDVFNKDQIGVIASATLDSDSGSAIHLDQYLVREWVNRVTFDNPPFGNGPTIQNKDYFPGDKTNLQDSYIAHPPRVVGKTAVNQFAQAHMFKCLRCGAEDKPVPHSGFWIEEEISKDSRGRKWFWQTRCTGSPTTVELLPDVSFPDDVTDPAKRKYIRTGPGIADIKSALHDLSELTVQSHSQILGSGAGVIVVLGSGSPRGILSNSSTGLRPLGA